MLCSLLGLFFFISEYLRGVLSLIFSLGVLLFLCEKRRIDALIIKPIIIFTYEQNRVAHSLAAPLD